jgi:two-component system sporulation sensor kinase A
MESETKYSVLVEESSDGVLIAQDEKIAFVNKRFAKIVGCPRDELRGMPFERIIVENYRQKTKERYMQVLRGEKVQELFETAVMSKNGEHVPIEVTSSLIHYQDRPADLIIARDIRERKRIEEQRRELEKLMTIGELATMVAHDLRNPLTSIRNASFYIRNICCQRTSCECKTATEMLDIIEQETLFANNIISSLLDFSIKRPLQKTEQNINAVIEDSITASNIPENIKVEKNFAENATANVDEKQLQRVFLNIIKNAVQAMPNGGKVAITTRENENCIEIAISDTGIGISEENIGKVFTPLFTTKARGIGLGLAICEQIVEEHGGKINVQSKISEGSTFTVKLQKKRETVDD